MRLGKYRLEWRIGRGAFSDVWRARDTVEHRRVALKIARPDVVRDYGRAALEKEARILVGLQHPHIVAVRNADWIEGYFIIATDLATRSLASYPGAKRSGPIALRIIRDVAHGLAYAHARRVLHRDVTPSNILLFEDGRAAIGDFGMSRFVKPVTATYTEAGTLGYMAPEQAYGRPALCSDVFSLGLIAYELLAGKLPTWPFQWPPEGIERFEERVPPELHPVLRRAAEFDPRRRYPDAVAFAAAFDTAARAAERRLCRPPPRRRRRREPAAISPLAVQAHLFQRRHGRRLDMRYRCYRCDLPVAETMQVCPWCGFSHNAFTEVTSAPLACPDCERGVEREWPCCPWCYPGRFETNGRPPKPDPRAVRTCPRRGCDGQLRPFMRYCPLCKQKVRRPWIDPELPDRCPRCHGSTSQDFWNHCPWCARRQHRTGPYA
jgi:serine/threonine-protein kinase